MFFPVTNLNAMSQRPRYIGWKF